MKKFTIILFAAILTVSITSAIKSVDAEGDSEYIMHIQVEVRNAQDQLVSVTESIFGNHVHHEIPDHVFDSIIAQKEIAVIDGIKYEKVEHTVSDVATNISMHDMQSFWSIEFCIKTKEHSNADQKRCIPIFQTITPHIFLGENDIFTLHWTILREIN